MKLSKMASLSGQLAEKFRGCLVGALVGDALGEPFEDEYSTEPTSKSVLTNYLEKFLASVPDPKDLSFQPYTDDTVMCWNIAQSLIQNQGFNATDMAKRFAEDYFRQPRQRGYGAHVVSVFRQLRATEYSDVFDPASHQFNGAGSYGNGAAMRVAPVALFCYNKSEQLIEMAKNSSLLTHTHRGGYNGAILQCLAVHQALKSDPSTDLNSGKFLDYLISSMEALEPDDNMERTGANAVAKEPWSAVGYKALKDMKCPKNLIDANCDLRPYCTKLKILQHLLTCSKKDLTPTEAFEVFGHGIAAPDSVPIAIYSFLRAQKPVPEFKTDNPFVRALYLSIRSGGDTDTIATMACAISGAYHGLSSIPEGFSRKCEQIDDCHKLADELFAAAMKE